MMAHSRAPITTPPNVVMGMAIGSGSPSSPSIQIMDKRDHLRNNNSSPSVNQSNNSHSHLHHHQNSRQVEDPQTAAQRQAAAKLALRKQLEKTLLQVHSSRQC